MYQDLTDRVNQVLDRQDDIFDYLKHGNDNGLANGNGNGQGQDNGNGNGNGQGNGNGVSDERIGVLSARVEEPEEEQQYHCEGCDTKFGQSHFDTHPNNCASCGEKFNWKELEGENKGLFGLW
jgi:hypothetical protein